MGFDDATLQQTLERVGPKETVRGFVFNAVLAHLTEKVGADEAQAIQAQLFKRKPNDLLNYPARDYFRLLHLGARVMEPLVGTSRAVRELGKASALGFFASPMGKLLLSILGSANPARLMSNAPTAYATSFSFGKRKFERTSENTLTLTHEQDPLPHDYNVGALEGALEAAKLSATTIAVEALGQDAARYTLTW